MYAHSRGRRRHSGPPSPLRHRGFHDGYDDDMDDVVEDFRRSDRGPNVLHDGRNSLQPGPTPAAHASFDTQRRPAVPIDHVEYSRGRRPTHQSAYSDLRGSGGHNTSAISAPFDRHDHLPRARRRPLRSCSPHHRERPHTHERNGPRGPSPVPPQSRPSRESRGSTSSSRSKSVSSASHHDRRKENAGTPWWQNPLVRACVVTAVSTGVSAALDSRGDPGQWKGAKGAKVAVATVGSALVDGFLGQKHPDGLRHKIMKKGVEVAMDEAEKKKKSRVDDAVDEEEEYDRDVRDARRSRSTRRHDSKHHHGDVRRNRSHDEGHRRRH
ncbi:hypothetical protein E4U43_003882 [Claviceps pusilla]|uniref:Uncharacterized protein n=1 Tax=Claviceps pusilla TaxID=123648 RepID=A0A9P7SWG9_9HYPO|nr:hypothetical protein E4U43_003882 [Claviceps pusilla]